MHRCLKTQIRSCRLEVFCKNSVPINFAKFTGEHLCQGLFLIKLQASACNFIKKEILVQMFPCEFWEISKNIFSYRTSPVAASVQIAIFNADGKTSIDTTSAFVIIMILLAINLW